MEQGTISERFRNIASFFILGYCMVFLGEVIIAASADIFAGSPTTMKAALVTAGLAHIIVKLTLPWVYHQVSYNGKIALLFSLYFGGVLIIVVSNSPGARLVGVVVFESGRAMAEVVFLSLTAFYGEFAIHSFVTGGGLGVVLGALYYSAVSTWTCVSPRVAVSVLVPFVFLFPLMYAILDKSPVQQLSKNISFAGFRYDAIDDQEEKQRTRELNIIEKYLVSWNIFMPMTYLYLQYFADQLSVQTVITSLPFPNKSLYFIGHFTYYMLVHNIGRLVGRSYLLVASITCSRVAGHVQVKKTWILAALGNALMFCFVFVSWFNFGKEVEAIWVLCFVIGLLTGSIYANSLSIVSEQTTDVTEREFALGMLTLGSSAGIYVAGLLGLFLRPYLTHHCMFGLELGEGCLPTFLDMPEWVNNARC